MEFIHPRHRHPLNVGLELRDPEFVTDNVLCA